MFHKFSVFFISTYCFCFWNAVFCWQHYKNRVFRKHSFSKLVKPTFSPMSKTPFSKKVSFLVLGNFRWSHYFYLVYTVLVPKKILAKTDSVRENTLFSPFLTQIVSGNFCQKSIFLDFWHFWMTTAKKQIFLGFFGIFHFVCFSFFCFYFSNIKKTKTKNAIFFSKPHFWHPPNLQKHYLKNREKQWKTWTSF